MAMDLRLGAGGAQKIRKQVPQGLQGNTNSTHAPKHVQLDENLFRNGLDACTVIRSVHVRDICLACALGISQMLLQLVLTLSFSSPIY